MVDAMGAKLPNSLRICILFLCYCCCALHGAPAAASHFVLELDIAIERGGMVEVLFDFGDGFWGENTAVSEVPAGSVPHTVRLKLPSRPIRRFRLDPTADDAPVLISGIRLLDERGTLLCRLDPKSIRPFHQIDRLIFGPEGVRILPTAKADDPMLGIDFAPAQRTMHAASGRPTVGPLFLCALAAIIVGTLVLGLRGAFRAFRFPEPLRQPRLVGIALFFAVFGARLAWLNAYGKAVPFWDEWEGDALYQLIPFAGGFLDYGALVMPQWEHRIVLTRTITLLGTWLNGEWDPRVAMTVSSAFWGASAALVGTALCATHKRSGVAAAAALAACASLPFDFSNLFWGGQTQMYGLVLLALVTIAFAATPKITTSIQLAALAASALSLFTMGAGMVGPACAAGICLVRLCWEKEQRGALARLAALTFCAALVGVLLHTRSRAHEPLYATSFAQFSKTFIGVLSWPLTPHALIAACIWLPWVGLGVSILRRRSATPLEWLAVGLGGWSLVNALALGYARQYEGPPFDSRFFTSFAVGLGAAVCANIALVQRTGNRFIRLGLWSLTGMLFAGLAWQGIAGIEGTRKSGAERAEMDHRVRLFLSQGDRQAVMDRPPHYRGNDVLEYLASPLLQRVLPAPFRRALAEKDGAAKTAPEPPAARTAPIEAGPITQAVRMLMRFGVALAVLGWIGFAWQYRRAHRASS